MNPPHPFINVERFEASMLLISFGNGWVACAPWATLSLGGSGGECPGDSISHGVDRYVMLKNQEPATKHPFFCTMPAAVDKYRRLDAWGRGQAVALAEEGYSSREIAQRVRKAPRGRRLGPHPDARSVRHLVRKARQDPSYRGESRLGPGRKPQLTEKEQQKLCELVFEHRGGAVVTTAFCQRHLPFLRGVSRWTVARALHKAGLAWLRRRQKKSVTPAARPSRIAYARWLRRQADATLAKQASVCSQIFRGEGTLYRGFVSKRHPHNLIGNCMFVCAGIRRRNDLLPRAD